MLKTPPETVTSQTEKVYCDGTSRDAGHPRVFLKMKDGKVDCPYCGKHFVLAASAKAAAH